jgi:hypothetical protein
MASAIFLLCLCRCGRRESRSATARGGVAGFFSRKIPVTESPRAHLTLYIKCASM